MSIAPMFNGFGRGWRTAAVGKTSADGIQIGRSMSHKTSRKANRRRHDEFMEAKLRSGFPVA